MSSGTRSWLIGVTMLAVAAGGFFTGVQLGERASEPGTQALTLDRPSDAAPRDIALRSPAGFTGFETGALGGQVTRQGVVTTGNDGAFDVETASARMRVSASSPQRLYRIVSSEEPLAAGDVVVIRLDEDGTAEAVLRVPADLREGDAR